MTQFEDGDMKGYAAAQAHYDSLLPPDETVDEEPVCPMCGAEAEPYENAPDAGPSTPRALTCPRCGGWWRDYGELPTQKAALVESDDSRADDDSPRDEAKEWGGCDYP
jgi:Zn-finger nucleic acid-binding protein